MNQRADGNDSLCVIANACSANKRINKVVNVVNTSYISPTVWC